MAHTTRITRFAPSPTGPLHIGHAYAAWVAAQRSDRFLLRFEDIDQARSKPQWEQAIIKDLNWLGLSPHGPILRQSERFSFYQNALKHLENNALTYYCDCSRGDIRAALSAPQEGVHINHGPDGPIYPGLCRHKNATQGAIRLNIKAAMLHLGIRELSFTETGTKLTGQHSFDPDYMINNIGDIVLARQDIGCSYHLAVVIDDAAQNITEVTRGEDLFAATTIHILLQKLLSLPTPLYHHHQLIRDNQGKRLAKRDDARSLENYRLAGATPKDIIDMLAQS